MKNLKIGDKAPEFIISISDDKQVSSNELKGKFIILYFYPKDDTPGCTIEAIDFNELLPEFTKVNAVVLGVSKDNLKSHDNFKDKYNLKLKLGADIEGKVCSSYSVLAEKSMFGKKYIGINRATFLINPTGEIAYIWPKVSVQNHAKEVLDQIKILSK